MPVNSAYVGSSEHHAGSFVLHVPCRTASLAWSHGQALRESLTESDVLFVEAIRGEGPTGSTVSGRRETVDQASRSEPGRRRPFWLSYYFRFQTKELQPWDFV